MANNKSNRAIFKFVADTRKKLPRYTLLCGAAFDDVGAIKLEIPKGFEFWKSK